MKRFLIYGCIIMFLAWGTGFVFFAHFINSYEIDKTTKTDAIIVLTGGKNRISEGIRLLNDNLADKLFISGVPSDISIKQIEKQAQVKADDENKIILGHKATNTWENAKETEEWIRKNNIKSIRLVTSSYHIPRSLQELIVYVTQDNNLEIILNPIYSPNVNLQWWRSWRTLGLLICEYNKFLIVYVCRHLHIH
ncbi:MAG: YdcF family protein [Pseudomonadota bacterium]|nr:YdcF family protein [Pseudomonadota bacterium]